MNLPRHQLRKMTVEKFDKKRQNENTDSVEKQVEEKADTKQDEAETEILDILTITYKKRQELQVVLTQKRKLSE